MDGYECQAHVGDWSLKAKVSRVKTETLRAFNERAKYEHCELLAGLVWALAASWPLFSECSSLATISRRPDGSIVCYLELRDKGERVAPLRKRYTVEAGSDWPLLLKKQLTHDPHLSEMLEQYRLWPAFL